MIHGWIVGRGKGGCVYVDEKWLKIRKLWPSWFVALDQDTELPLLTDLSPSRTKWVCSWCFLLLTHLGNYPRAVITDGLCGYKTAIAWMLPRAKHLACLFHHQESVSRWLREHGVSLPEETRKWLKRQMKRVVQTCDVRTVKRRSGSLKAQEAKPHWGLDAWLNTVRDK